MALIWVGGKLLGWTMTKFYYEYQRKFKAFMLELS